MCINSAWLAASLEVPTVGADVNLLLGWDCLPCVLFLDMFGHMWHKHFSAHL